MIRGYIKRFFPSVLFLRNRIYNYLAHIRFRNKSTQDVFEAIYNENHWKDAESKSGTGSNVKNTAKALEIVNKTFEKYSISTMLDIPCGDFNWMKKANLSLVNYIGADIVEELIQSNNLSSKSNIQFMHLDLLTNDLPKVDLIFTRDCLVHLSYYDIFKAIDNVKRSGSKFWMLTTFTDHKNHNIVTGDWRPVNLQAPPFNLPTPLSIFSEECREDDRYFDKSLGIWSIDSLK